MKTGKLFGLLLSLVFIGSLNLLAQPIHWFSNKTIPDKTITAIFAAVKVGDKTKLQSLVEDSYSSLAAVNVQNTAQDTPLIIACQYNNVSIVEYLLKKGALVNTQGYLGRTALMHAVSKGNIETVNKLLAKGAELETKDSDQLTALMYASYYGYYEIVKKLLANKAEVNAKGYQNRTALSLAIANGHLSTAKLLVANGANPRNILVLQSAFIFGRLSQIDYLLSFNSKLENKLFLYSLLTDRIYTFPYPHNHYYANILHATSRPKLRESWNGVPSVSLAERVATTNALLGRMNLNNFREVLEGDSLLTHAIEMPEDAIHLNYLQLLIEQAKTHKIAMFSLSEKRTFYKGKSLSPLEYAIILGKHKIAAILKAQGIE